MMNDEWRIVNDAGHKIFCRHQNVGRQDRLQIPLIKKCVLATLDSEGVDAPCEISVLVTNDDIIQGINLQYRDSDKPTDVLSFPMQEFSEPGWAYKEHCAADPETGLIPLGEIVLSAKRVMKQAEEFGHPPEKETAYLTVHSVLHLLGYDHMDEAAGKKRMRKREKEILREIGFLI